MREYVKKLILNIESDKRVAFTKKYPFLLFPVIEMKRFYKKVNYTYPNSYNLKHTKVSVDQKWFHITDHSSPLYRKYNKRELDDGKIKNIKIAIQKIDGLILEPNQIFSFWKHVGRTSKNRGFLKGIVLSDGNLKEDFGGGLCQLSNLIAYMFACSECTFIERKHHSRDVFPDSGRNIPFASGATVFYNLIDLKIKNTYNFPIRINIRTTDTQLRGSLSSPKQLDYEVKLEEKNTGFFRSSRTNLVYRYNQLLRVFYKKGNSKLEKEKIKEVLLWENIAKVIYKSSEIKKNIEII
ncbi:MAG: VanW family protein [Candidatus Pacebacteria bacterium]|nr:VanW family protein [Candidatus Paceibacterota bacterium]MBP9867039.1 VanW family protein [Candidatus Paceibacterota bacterium]